MDNTQTDAPAARRPLRLWPGVLAVALQWLARFVLPLVVPEATIYGILGGVLGGGLAVALWWLFFSRAPWSERIGALVLMVAALLGTFHLVDEPLAQGGMGMLLPILAIPVLSLALVCWAVASQRLSRGLRRATLAAALLLRCGVFTLLRTGGITGGGRSDLHWRWTQTPEQRLLAMADDAPVGPPTPTAARNVAEWPGFRGPGRDGIVRGVRLATDWPRSPPVELWRRPIGPGWSSFAVQGDFFYT
jgi:hypothetical protein